jgi:7,8-dihydropterin-6-yl-methyl-4-(beta-D-ribofuranosyl)aminobenzene 5'-phosphate synthase
LTTLNLRPVDDVAITVLVDNVSDALMTDLGPAKRMGALASAGAAPRLPAPTLEGGEVMDALRAEHGFAALVSVMIDGQEHRILFDTGITPDGLIENMRRLSLSPKDIEVIVLSHGHFDHTTGLSGLVRALGRTNMPVMIHPEFWTKRRIAIPGRDAFEMPSTSRSALTGAGFEIIEERAPSFLLDGAILITGEVDRTTEFEKGFPIHQAMRDGGWQPDPQILDDQALIVNVAGKGLVVLTGCGHAGVVNVLRYARKLTGVEEIYAVIGGFHLSGVLFEPLIGPTCDALAVLSPRFLVPAHCTGWKAQHAMAARFPDAYVPNTVGTRFEL